jgi:hypothetical protein
MHDRICGAGHEISLTTAVQVVLACCKYRIPEPLRQADLLSRQFVRDSCGTDGANLSFGTSGQAAVAKPSIAELAVG